MVDEMDRELADVRHAFEEMDQHFHHEDEIDLELKAKLMNEIKKLEGIDAEKLYRFEEAIDQLDKSENEELSSASASGQIFDAVRKAFRLVLQNRNVQYFGQRAGEETYMNVVEHLLDRYRQQSSQESEQATGGSAEQASEVNAEKMVKNIYHNCSQN